MLSVPLPTGFAPFAPDILAYNMYITAETSLPDGPSRPRLTTLMEESLVEMEALKLHANAVTFNAFCWAAFKRNDLPLAQALLTNPASRVGGSPAQCCCL